jgi:rifampicin phosphotransferase
MTEYVLSFDQIGSTKLALAGGKGANLGELSRVSGIRVPMGVCVTTNAYGEVVAHNAHLTALLDELSQLAATDTEAIQAASARIREVIEGTPIPAGIAKEIGGQLGRLGNREAFAVRSSATAEDLPTASFAGQQDTYLNVTGKNAVLQHISKCWASLFTDRAVAYRLQQGIDHRSVQLAVVIQRMVLPDVAGIMFTADPITFNRKVTSIEAGFGLGETLVAGIANADNYKVRDGQIIDRKICAQGVAVHAAPEGGTEAAEIDAHRRSVQKLTDAQILRLASIGRIIEAHFGLPQDVEWCLVDDTFFIVQSRPITTLFPIPGRQDGKNHVHMSFGHQQMMTDAIKPLGLSFFQLGFEETTLIPAGGRLYMDMTSDLASPVGRSVALATMKSIDPLMRSAIKTLKARKHFMKGLAREGQRSFSAKGSGYFSWALPVEAVKLYRNNDPNVVQALISHDDTVIDDLQRRIATRSGDELFKFVLEDLRLLKEAMYSPRSMAVVYNGMYALNWINKHMEKWLDEKGAADSLAQLVANNVTSDMGLALLDLADTVRRHPGAMAVLPNLKDADFFTGLGAVPGGDVVSRSIHDYLQKYGIRCPGEIDLTRPRWSETPSQLVPVILSHIKNLGPNARETKLRQSRLQAENMQKDLLDRLERLPGGRRKAKKTLTMISRLRNFAGYREYPKFLMMRHYWILKRAMLKEATGLVEKGIIRAAEDVYYLSFEEFRETVRTGRLDYDLITHRKDEFEIYARMTPPRVITSDGEVIAGEYENRRIPNGALAGIPASAGTVEGRARVILALEEASLEQGDILVTAYTDPSWTPLFLGVKGLVTAVGGAMTHGAVVAREYGLPAVAGVDGATRLIQDGQQIRVNGTKGYVEIL